MIDDKRQDLDRHLTMKGGRIILGGRSTLNCIVRNVSPSGARLQFSTTIGVPESFEVSLGPGEPPRPCRVAWRSPTDVGVVFED